MLLFASLSWVGFLVLLPLTTAGPGVLLFALGNAGFGAGVVVTSIVTRTHQQTITPPELLPRVMATVRFISRGVLPIGALTAGSLGSVLGVRAALWVIAGIAALGPMVLFRSAVRDLRELADPLPEEVGLLTPEADRP